MNEIKKLKIEADLAHLENILMEQKCFTQMIEASERSALPSLLLALKIDSKERERYLNLMFLDAETEDLNTQILQFYISFPYEVKNTKAVKDKIIELNPSVYPGAFYLTGNNLYYRYIHLSPEFEIIKDNDFIELVDMVVGSMDMQYEFLEKVATS